MRIRQCLLQNYLAPRSGYNAGKEFSIGTWRKKVLERDSSRCQHCFNSIKDTFRERKSVNEAHHIVARRHGGKNTLNNGITLCTFCHDYFDRMYGKHGYDYHQIVGQISAEQRLYEVRHLLRKHYAQYLWRKIVE